MTEPSLMTVQGPIPAAELGRTLVHEHVRIAFAGWDLDPRGTMSREQELATAVTRMRELAAVGVRTFVDPCPIELGRDVELLREVSVRSGMHIVCATGFYHEEDGIGIPYYWRVRWVEEIAELFLDEIRNGIKGTSIRPGVIKTATSTPVGRHDRKILAASAIAARESGLAIITHTTHSGGVMEQLDAFEKGGVDPARCLIGHQDEQRDYSVLKAIVERGHFVGFDRIGISRLADDEHRADMVARLVHDGYVRSICLSQDHMCYDIHPRPAYWIPPNRAEEVLRDIKPVADLELHGRPHTYLFTDFLPRLRQRGVTDEHIEIMLVENPRRLLTGSAA